jgi:hypothetical protein
MESDAIPAEKLGFDCAGHPAGTKSTTIKI